MTENSSPLVLTIGKLTSPTNARGDIKDILGEALGYAAVLCKASGNNTADWIRHYCEALEDTDRKYDYTYQKKPITLQSYLTKWEDSELEININAVFPASGKQELKNLPITEFCKLVDGFIAVHKKNFEMEKQFADILPEDKANTETGKHAMTSDKAAILARMKSQQSKAKAG